MILRRNPQGIGNPFFLQQLGRNLRHRLGGIDEMDGFPDNFLQEGLEEGVMGAAQHQGVHMFRQDP